MSTARSIAPISPADLARLEELYTLRDRAIVLRFLRKYSFLMPMLLEGADQARRYFPDAALSLEFYRDPEDAKLNHLYAAITTDLSLEEESERRDQFGENWWLNVIAEADMKLNFDVESSRSFDEPAGKEGEYNTMTARHMTTALAPADLIQIEQYYQLPRRGEVIQWLEQYPVLVPLLLEARDKLWEHFGDAVVSLEVVIDPEMIGYAQLIAFIIPKAAPDEAIDQLERFDDAWWLDNGEQGQDKLEFIVTYR